MPTTVFAVATAEFLAFAVNFFCLARRHMPVSARMVVGLVAAPCVGFPPEVRCVALPPARGLAHGQVINRSVRFRDATYMSFVRTKLTHQRRWLEATADGELVLFADVDIAVRGDVFSLVRSGAPEALFARDRCAQNVLNSGFFFLRASNRTRALLREAERNVRRGATYDGGDQGALQRLVHRVVLLPCVAVAPGHRLAHRQTQGLHAFHMNWVASSHEKQQRMRRVGWWVATDVVREGVGRTVCVV